MRKCVIAFLLSLTASLANAQVQEIPINTDGTLQNDKDNIIVSHLRDGGFAGKMIHELGIFSLMKNNMGEEKALNVHQVGSSLWNAFSTKGLVTLLGASSGVGVFVGVLGGVLVYKSMETPKQIQLAKLKNSNPTQLALTQGREYPLQMSANNNKNLSEATFEIVPEIADPIEGLRNAMLPELVLTPLEKKSMQEVSR